MTSALSTAKVARNEPVVWSITSPRGATTTDSDAGQPGSSKGDTSVKVAVIGAIALVVAAGVTAALQKFSKRIRQSRYLGHQQQPGPADCYATILTS